MIKEINKNKLVKSSIAIIIGLILSSATVLIIEYMSKLHNQGLRYVLYIILIMPFLYYLSYTIHVYVHTKETNIDYKKALKKGLYTHLFVELSFIVTSLLTSVILYENFKSYSLSIIPSLILAFILTSIPILKFNKEVTLLSRFSNLVLKPLLLFVLFITATMLIVSTIQYYFID